MCLTGKELLCSRSKKSIWNTSTGIRPLWERLIQANAANSPYFADYYGTFEFSVRKSFLQEKLDSGAAMYTAVLVDGTKSRMPGSSL